MQRCKSRASWEEAHAAGHIPPTLPGPRLENPCVGGSIPPRATKKAMGYKFRLVAHFGFGAGFLPWLTQLSLLCGLPISSLHATALPAHDLNAITASQLLYA